MFKKLTLAAAAGAGYVLGAKAGKERYNQIEAKFREIAGMPAVQNATATVKETASGVADSAKATVNEKVESASGKSKSDKGGDVVVDLGTGANTGATSGGTLGSTGSTLGGTSTGSGSTLGSTSPSTKPSTSPITGASPSGSAPDITRP